MKALEIVGMTDKEVKTKLHTMRRKKNNPVKSRTTKLDSFIDVFGGMSGYGGSSSSTNFNINPS
jgi:hypothetical protein